MFLVYLQIGQLVFKGMKRLNRIQSIVFETAYNTNENLLICAPTGAGKTNIAMLTIIHEIRQHLQPGGVIRKDQFKVNSRRDNIVEWAVGFLAANNSFPHQSLCLRYNTTWLEAFV